jgi:hypothetical protein
VDQAAAAVAGGAISARSLSGVVPGATEHVDRAIGGGRCAASGRGRGAARGGSVWSDVEHWAGICRGPPLQLVKPLKDHAGRVHESASLGLGDLHTPVDHPVAQLAELLHVLE